MISPEEFEGYVGLGHALLQQFRFQEAEQVLAQGLKLENKILE